MDFLNSLWSGLKSAGSGILNLFGGGNNQTSWSKQTPQYTPFSGMTSSGPGYAVNSTQTSSGGNGFLGGLESGIGSVLNMFGNPKSLLGAGALGLGLLKGNPKVPALPQSVEQLRGMAQSGGTPLGQQAQGNLSNTLSQKFNPLTDPEIEAATRNNELQKNEAIKRLQGVYGSLRPGTDYTTDSNYKMDLQNTENSFAQQGSDIVANRSRSAMDAFNTNQRYAAQQALGASDTQMAQLGAIAQLDINQIMTKLNMDYNSAQQFKQTFLNLGGQLLLSGFGAQPNPFSGFSVTGK